MTSSNHSPETKDVGFATKYEDLFASIQYFSMCFAAAEKVLWPIICRLSCNNRPITDYLKNGRLIGFADYLPINRLIPIVFLVLTRCFGLLNEYLSETCTLSLCISF
jgi:hypothetical protein